MYDIICTLSLPSDVFAQVIHPTEPWFAVGLSSGHVQAYKLPSDTDVLDDASQASGNSLSKASPAANGSAGPPLLSSLRRSSTGSASECGLGSVETLWTTRRHKGSCRCLTFSPDGHMCYSAGTDGLVKAFSAETGRVQSKVAVPRDVHEEKDTGPTVLHALSPQALLLGTDAGRLYLHDLRQDGSEIGPRPAQTWSPHGDEHVNALVPLPVSDHSTSGYPKQWVSVGGTTLAVTDLRKGVVRTSEDQEVELYSLAVVQGLKHGGTSTGEKVLAGQADGVVGLWEKGVWDDIDERIVADRGGLSVDTLAEVPYGFGARYLKMNEKLVAAGLEDGRVRFLRLGRNGILPELDAKHDEIDGVVGLGFDVEGRMITGGGQTVKVWTEAKGLPGGGRAVGAKHDQTTDDEDSDAGSGDGSNSGDEELRPTAKRKKRKRNRGKDKAGGKVLDFSL